MPNLPLVPGTLAQDCYSASPQALYEEMFQKGYAVAPDITGILIQDAAPDAIYRGNKGWIPTSGGVPIYPGYVFIWHATVGHWVSRNPIGASDSSRRIFVGSSADVTTYDGGDANAPGIASGPMWSIDTLFDGRTPIGVGVIPTSAPAASIAAPLDTVDTLGNSGEYKHTLTEAEGAVGSHIHPIGVCDPATDDGFFNITTPSKATPAWSGHYITGSGSTPPTAETTANLYTLPANDGNGVTAVGHLTMQPFIGVFFLKRTSRQWYVLG